MKEFLPGKHPHNLIHSPLIGGTSVGPEGDTGTLGIVLKTENFGICGITAQHVIEGGKDTIVYQPAPLDSTLFSREIGTVVDLTSGEKDVALIQIFSNISTLQGRILGETNKVRGFVKSEEIDSIKGTDLVTKSGRTTGVTKGYIYDYPVGPYDQIWVESGSDYGGLSDKGDSGSIWLTRDGRILGVHLKSMSNRYAILQPFYQLPWKFLFG